MEKVIGPMPFDHAVIYLVGLKDNSQSFIGGARPVIGRLKMSYGYKKIIGTISLDNKVRTRIDYDPIKGYHFNFENDNTEEKVCILINDMTKEQYEKYIDNLSKGRGVDLTPKMPIINRSVVIEDMKVDIPKKKGSYRYEVLERFKDELFHDKFLFDYYTKLLQMYINYEIDLSLDEIHYSNEQIVNLNNKIDNNLSLANWFF